MTIWQVLIIVALALSVLSVIFTVASVTHGGIMERKAKEKDAGHSKDKENRHEEISSPDTPG